LKPSTDRPRSLGGWWSAQALHQRAVLVPQLLGGVVAEGVEVLGDQGGLLAPDLLVDGEEELQVAVGEVEAVGLEGVLGRGDAEGGLDEIGRASCRERV